MFWRYNLSSLAAILFFLVAGKASGDSFGIFISSNLPNWLLLIAAGFFILPGLFPGYRVLGRLKTPMVKMLVLFAGANHLAACSGNCRCSSCLCWLPT